MANLIPSIVKSICLSAIALHSVSCYQHTTPDTESFISDTPVQLTPAVRVFVDCNGTFYPSGWSDTLKKADLRRGNASLLNYAYRNKKEFIPVIESDEKRQLKDIAYFTKSKKRILILVHGYNNTEKSARESYEAVESKLDLKKEDGIIHFYWDGLNGALLGGAPIWWSATGYSQPAGSRGLRQILNQISNKEVHIFGHSRGTSVILSALSNPGFSDAFKDSTRDVVASWGSYNPDTFLFPPPLKENGNRFHVIAMAPAVDEVDFSDPVNRQARRALGKQLIAFRYSVNWCDPTLNKYLGLSGYFNPTRLGCREKIADKVNLTYKDDGNGFKSYVMKPGMLRHGWESYVANPVFDEILRDAGIAKK